MSEWTADKVRKVIACSPLLPPPGDEVVKDLCIELLRVMAERDTARAELAALERLLAEVQGA